MRAAGAQIFGISYDSVVDNAGWHALLGLDFSLLSDPDHRVAEALEAARPPEHEFGSFPRRLTYIIDPDLIIRQSYDVGRDIEGHDAVVLKDLLALKAQRS